MNKKIIILISGKAGTGKSYRADLIKSIFREEAIIASFAKPLKDALNPACWSMFKKKIQELTPEEKEQFRPVLQTYGQVGRAISNEYWVDKTKEIVNNSSADIGIIDDCRFENELHSFDEDYNVIKIRLNRTSANKDVNQDESETALDHIDDDEFDMVVTDDWSGAYFVLAITGAINEVLEKEHTKGDK